ncbi:hypothetical protein HanIR_Chr07g0312501 [Helianthus annuus]|nr:hypothetical protein HanIR_Chr07g0312501 [Helianthus annuus]
MKEMRSLCVFLVLFSLLLVIIHVYVNAHVKMHLGSVHEARKDLEDSTMSKDKEIKKDQFVRDFDAQPNLKMFTKGFNPKPSSLVSNEDPSKSTNGCPPKNN